MDYTTIIAFALGVIIVAAFFIIKERKLTKADRIASEVIALLNKTLDKYAEEIKAYDAENGTDYFNELSKMVSDIKTMEEDPEITPLEFALYVVNLKEDIEAILTDLNILDKVKAAR